MVKSVFIYSHAAGSRGAATIAQGLGIKKIRRENSAYKGNRRKTVINWGSSRLSDQIMTSTVINPPQAVARASNKLLFLQDCAAMREEVRPRTPEFTLNKEVAAGWLSGERPRRSFARTIVNGSGGAGIVKINTVEDLASIPDETLIVQYVPKIREFRLHVERGGNVFSVQEKLRRHDTPDDQVDWQIRNLENGFIFARNDIQPPDDVFLQCRRAIDATGLDFGAIDVLYNARRDEAYVIEVNTAPGLEGTTGTDYVEMFERKLNANQQAS